MQLFGFHVANSLCEIAHGLSALVLAICAVVGGMIGWKRWSDEKALSRSRALDSLLEKFNNNELRNLVCKIDSSGGASDLLRSAMSETGDDDKVKVENALAYVALLCQLKATKVVSDTEFLLFKDSIMKILDDDDVKAYVCQAVADSGLDPDETHYALLLKFANENGIDICVAGNNDKEDACRAQNMENASTATQSLPINATEFDLPTAIIKINRKYREDMNDTEVYDAVRGWWRLRKDVADKVKIVLAVAHGYVKGVYRVEKWLYATSPDALGRIGFEGGRSDEITRKKFMGRSTKGLFSQGAANPVRYFNVK